MVGVDWTNVNLAGAFLVGAILATVATLRVVRAVTQFFAGVDRHPRRELSEPRRDSDPQSQED